MFHYSIIIFRWTGWPNLCMSVILPCQPCTATWTSVSVRSSWDSSVRDLLVFSSLLICWREASTSSKSLASSTMIYQPIVKTTFIGNFRSYFLELSKFFIENISKIYISWSTFLIHKIFHFQNWKRWSFRP